MLPHCSLPLILIRPFTATRCLPKILRRTRNPKKKRHPVNEVAFQRSFGSRDFWFWSGHTCGWVPVIHIQLFTYYTTNCGRAQQLSTDSSSVDYSVASFLVRKSTPGEQVVQSGIINLGVVTLIDRNLLDHPDLGDMGPGQSFFQSGQSGPAPTGFNNQQTLPPVRN